MCRALEHPPEVQQGIRRIQADGGGARVLHHPDPRSSARFGPTCDDVGVPSRQPPEPVLETVLIEDGRIRLLHRHLLRLRRAGASVTQIEAVRALADTWSRTATEPTVIRFDVTPDAMVSSRARAPASTDAVRLVTVG